MFIYDMYFKVTSVAWKAMIKIEKVKRREQGPDIMTILFGFKFRIIGF